MDMTLAGVEAPEDLDQNYTKEITHSINISLFVRDMFATDADEIDRLIERISYLLNGYDVLDTHSFSEHTP
jgi:hypothetical protein